MSRPQQEHHARPGDVLEILPRKVGRTPLRGEIIDVLGESDDEHYRVRWLEGKDAGQEAIVVPADGVIVHPAGESHSTGAEPAESETQESE